MQSGGPLQQWRCLLHWAHSLSQLALGRHRTSSAAVHLERLMRRGSMPRPSGMYLTAAKWSCWPCLHAGSLHLSFWLVEGHRWPLPCL